MTPRIRRALTTALATGSIAMLIAGGALTATRASAFMEQVEETGAPGLLQLRAAPHVQEWRTLRPGDAVHWPIEVWLADAEWSTLQLEIRAEGELVTTAGLTATVIACGDAFVDPLTDAPRCESRATTVLARTPLVQIAGASGSDRFALAELRPGVPRNLLVTLALPAAADPSMVQDATASIGIGLHAEGEAGESGTVGSAPDGRLPVTGADLGALGLLGAGLAGLGAALVLRPRPPEGS